MKQKFILFTIMLLTLMGGVKFNVLNAQEEPVLVDGSTTKQHVPISATDKYSTTQFFYSKDQINKADGTITKLAFYTGNGTFTGNRNIQIYLRNTTYYSFNSNTYPYVMDESEKVFDGEVKDITKNKTIEIDIDDFNYTGDNLLVCVHDYTGTDPNKNLYFYTTGTSNVNDMIIVLCNKGTTQYEPTSDISGTFFLRGSSYCLPKITFTFSSGGGTVQKEPVFTETYQYPLNNATNLFAPSFQAYVTDATHYRILVAEDVNFTSPMYVAGSANTWEAIADGVKEINSTTILDLDYTGKTYYWKAQAKNGENGEEVESTTFSFTTVNLTSAPTVPTAATLSYPENEAKVDVNPLLGWELGDYTEEYSVYLGTSADSLKEVKPYSYITRDEYQNSAASYQTSGLETGTYYWQIKTKNDAGESSSEVRSFTKVGRPDNVTQLSPATGVTSSIIEWQFAENTTAYRILINDGGFAYVGDSKGGIWIETKGATTASYDLGELTPNKTYEWCIDVMNDAGSREYWVNTDDVTIFTSTAASTLPVSYTTPAEGATGLDNPELSWTYKGKAVSYQVYLGTDANELQAATEELARGTVGTGLSSTDSYQTTNLEVATKYYWRVDVKDAEGNVYKGAVRSFVSTFPAITNADSDKTQVYPYDPKVTIYWSGMNKATKYEVYKDGVFIGETVNTQYQATGLTYSKEGYDFTVVAIYEYGKSEHSNVVENIKVTGYGTYKLTITDNNTGNAVTGAEVALIGTDEFGKEQTYNTTTDENGVYTIQNILVGTYTATVEKADYETISIENIQINYGEVTAENSSMTSELYFNVTLGNITKDQITIYLDGTGEGYYDISVTCGDSVIEKQTNCWFQKVGSDNLYVSFIFDNWSYYRNGSYTFSVSKAGSDVANTAQAVVRNYDIAEKGVDWANGAWTDEKTWRDEVPGENGDVYITAGALVTIGVEDNITVKNLTIELGGQLTINGSLTVTGKMTNSNGVSGLILNDGCQLRQSSDDVLAKFVMNIKSPTEWTGNNKDGWQFISVPFKDEVEITEFINEGSDYDLYRYDGSNVGAEWVNQKDESNEPAFEMEFILQKGYLASYEKAGDFNMTGIVNNATTFMTQYGYKAENEMANFYLIGNPFTFNMDMSKLSLYNMVQGYAVLNEAGSGYEYLSLDGEVKVGDAFFVKTTNSYPTAMYGAAATSRGKASESISIIATSKAGKDNVVINFAGKSEGFNKLQNFNDAIATVYVAEDGNNYGIYNCDADVQEVELNFNANKMGNYTISIEPNGEFETVTLVDRFTGVETNMLLEDYNFTAMSSDNHNRFIVRFANGQETTDDSHFVYQSGEELILNIQGDVQIVDVLGRVVYNGKAMNDINHINVSSFNSGAYMIRVMNGNEVKVEKIIL